MSKKTVHTTDLRLSKNDPCPTTVPFYALLKSDPMDVHPGDRLRIKVGKRRRLLKVLGRSEPRCECCGDDVRQFTVAPRLMRAKLAAD